MMKRGIILIIVFLLTVPCLFAQEAVPAVSCDSAVSRVLTMGTVLPPERVYMQFDNGCYFLGETIWFKAHVTSNNDDRPTEFSRVLYVELLAPEGYVIKTEKYEIGEDGTCVGEIYLDPLYLSGFFEIRAYTRYMLNWGDSMAFSRVFPVFDKVNGNNWEFRNMLDRKRGFHAYDIDKEENSEECILKFYPEGGHLVDGLESRVAYEITCGGKECHEEITILDRKRVVLKTTPLHMGKGVFAFTPSAEAKYMAVVNVKNSKGKEKKYSFKLPDVESRGVALQVHENDSCFRFDIKNTLPSSSSLAFALLHRSSIGYYNKINSSDTAIVYTPDVLPEGVCRAVVFSGEVPLAERLFFVEHDTLLKNDRAVVRLNITVNGEPVHKFTPAPHERITVVAERCDSMPLESTAQFAVSVADEAGVQQSSWSYSMYTYLLLGSELKGYIPNVAQYFNPENRERKAHLDLLMMTNGWTAYDWSKLTSDETSSLVAPEKGLTLRGKFYMRVHRKVVEQPFVPVRFDIAYDGKKISTNAFRTDERASFDLPIKPFYGKQIAALSPNAAMKQNENISYTFALDRYFSPLAQPYSYWQCNLGRPASAIDTKIYDTITKVNPFEYILSDIEIVGENKKNRFARPPLSELRFDYLDEWEYAKDVTYLNGPYGDPRLNIGDEHVAEYLGIDNGYVNDSLYNNDSSAGFDFLNKPGGDQSVFYANEDIAREGLKNYSHVLSASNVLSSIFKRHRLGWCWWVSMAVVDGEYNKDSVPRIDAEYLHGINVEKMVNFKEVIITSDRKKVESIKGGYASWNHKSNALSNKGKHSIFYSGFLSPVYMLNSTEQINSNSSVETLRNVVKEIRERFSAERAGRAHGHFDAMETPNHVAYFLPYTERDSAVAIKGDFSAPGTRRYTRVQGYTRSKQFYSPDYSRMKPDSADYRRTLLWNPSVKACDGRLQFDFYNSAFCENLSVNIEGRNKNTYYNSAPNTYTRVHAGENAVDAWKNLEVKIVPPDKDSLFWAECMKEYNMAEINFSQNKYGRSLTTYIELAGYGFAPAIYKVGLYYLKGLYLKKNYKMAFEFMHKAAEKGYTDAQYELAMLYLAGNGTAKNDAEAVRWLKEAVAQGLPHAQYELAKIYLDSDVMRDSLQGVAIMRESALKGHPGANFRYSCYMKAAGVTDSILGTPLQCMERAAVLEESNALLYMLGYSHENGDYNNAYRWARSLQLQGNHKGIKYMADCYLLGRVVRRSKKTAKDLYRDAARRGNSDAERILREW